MKTILLILGPALFLLAEIILPGGSTEPALRTAIIRENGIAWELGHQIVLFAFVLLLLWLAELYRFVQSGNEHLAYLGFLISAFALIADYGVGILQLVTLDLVRNESADLVQQMLTVIVESTNILLFAFLPTLGFLIGFGMLAIGYNRTTQQSLPALLLGMSGFFVTLASILQIKIIFILGSLALLAFTIFFIRLNLFNNPDTRRN